MDQRQMQASNQPHNVLLFQQTAVVVPRSIDPRDRGRFSEPGMDFGCNELAGWFTVFDQPAYDRLSAEGVRAALRRCSAPLVAGVGGGCSAL